MKLKELTLKRLTPAVFIERQTREITATAESTPPDKALTARPLPAVVTLHGHRALGRRLKTYFVENGLMREGEAAQVVAAFKKLGVTVEVIDARRQFFAALKGVTDPEEKREAITREVPGVVSVTCNIASKPPSCIEAV